MNISDYYFHTLLKDNIGDNIYINFEKILDDGKLKSQRLLNHDEMKFNGLDYISLASYVGKTEYKTFVIDECNYRTSELSKKFKSYHDYLDYLKLDEWLEKPKSREDFFKESNTNNKREYYNYLDSISRRYPVDIKCLYESTNDLIYKYILDVINADVLYCNKSEYCFQKYIRNSKGITFIFPKTIDVIEVRTIPNLPFEIENELVNTLQNLSIRYSNQIGEVQVKDYLDINKAIGVIIDEKTVNKSTISNLLNKYNLSIKIFKLKDNQLIEL